MSPASVCATFAAILCAVAFGAGSVAGAAPGNDDFALAEALDDQKGSLVGTTKGATREAGEPSHAGNAGGASVWYRWTPDEDVFLAISTEGSTFDTLLAVYTGTAVEALTEVASNDDVPEAETSSVRFDAVAGTEYRIAIDGYAGEVGVLRLAWNEAPRNDDFAQAQTIAGEQGRVEGSNENTTGEPGEPEAGGSTSIWYRWTAPRSAMFRFETAGSNFDTVLAVYTGQRLDNLEALTANDDFLGLTSGVSFAATEGVEYSISIAGFNNRTGSTVLSWFPGAIIVGTDADNTLGGTPGRDYIDASDGNDRVSGGDGNDTIVGGDGNDRLAGGNGRDVISGGEGSDGLRGDAGNDRLDSRDGVPGNDTVRGGHGVDRCRTDAGDGRRGCP